MMLLQHSVNRDRLFNTQSRVLQADWFILEINEKATLNSKPAILIMGTYTTMFSPRVILHTFFLIFARLWFGC